MTHSPAFQTSAAMQGFATEFRNLDDYIRVITDRIWECRQIEAIRDYYSEPCGVITPSGATTDVQSVIDGTKATLAQFPDRRLLAEDVIEAGNAQEGFLSSHRIISTMTHLGDGNFGQATGKKVIVRTVADCVCKDNRIVHEWLVRDQGAIARAVGSTPQALAGEWLATKGGKITLPLPQPAAPLWWRNPQSDEPIAQSYAKNLSNTLTGAGFDEHVYDEAACSMGPSNRIAYGRADIRAFYAKLASIVQKASFSNESLSFMPANGQIGRPPRLALRWRVKATSPEGKPLDVLGISHVEFVKVNAQWQIHREWVLIDEIALWMQRLSS
ncbi:MAG: hypothetical protein ACKO1L_13970 [Brachymonas sp.]